MSQSARIIESIPLARFLFALALTACDESAHPPSTFGSEAGAMAEPGTPEGAQIRADADKPQRDRDAAVDAQEPERDAAPADAGSDGALPSSDDANPLVRPECPLNQSEILGRASGASLGDSVAMDDDHIYWTERYLEPGPDGSPSIYSYSMHIAGIDRHDPEAKKFYLLKHSDQRGNFMVGKLVPDNLGHVFFVGTVAGSTPGIYRIDARAPFALTGPLVSSESIYSDLWLSQLAMDDDAWYVASADDGSVFQILRIARSKPHRREVLWSARGSNNTFGALSLNQSDIALDKTHVYFTTRINGNGNRDSQVRRINKQGLAQQALDVGGLHDSTYGGLACDGKHLMFFDAGRLKRMTLSGEQVTELSDRNQNALLLSEHAGVLSWNPTDADGIPGDMRLLCLTP